jgi:NTE family protein
VGLVLGAGGTAGAAFHAGTLLALEQDLGWDPRTADVVVGTSAGSIIGGLLRAGLTTDDLAAWGSSAAPLPGRNTARRILDRMDDVGMRVVGPRFRPRVPGLRWWGDVLGRSDVRPHAAFLSLLPHGPIDASKALRGVDDLLGAWPDRPLWVNAVRLADARRIVFGRDAHARVSDAVAASCAIPGVFRPARVDGTWYLDGGAHSPTNADVLRDADVDVAIVLSPMSSPRRSGGNPVVRSLCHRLLRREVTQLTDAGIAVEVFEPDAATCNVMGWNALDRARSGAIVTSSFLTAGVGRFVDEPDDSVLNRLRSSVARPTAGAA